MEYKFYNLISSPDTEITTYYLNYLFSMELKFEPQKDDKLFYNERNYVISSRYIVKEELQLVVMSQRETKISVEE